MSSSPPRPNLFVAGFAKCGTTALQQYLATHPNIHVCFPKEPHFFIEDAWRRRPAKTESEYLRYFAGASKNARVFVDSSALYVYSQRALRQIREFNPDAKLILMVRHPVDMLASGHRYSCRMFIEE